MHKVIGPVSQYFWTVLNYFHRVRVNFNVLDQYFRAITSQWTPNPRRRNLLALTILEISRTEVSQAQFNRASIPILQHIPWVMPLTMLQMVSTRIDSKDLNRLSLLLVFWLQPLTSSLDPVLIELELLTLISTLFLTRIQLLLVHALTSISQAMSQLMLMLLTHFKWLMLMLWLEVLFHLSRCSHISQLALLRL